MSWAEYEKDIAKSEPRKFESWRPAEGDSILGRVVGLRRIDTKFGTQNVADLEAEDGTVTTVFLSTLLDRQFQEYQVAEGDVVGIRFLGKANGKGGGSIYDLVIDGEIAELPEDLVAFLAGASKITWGNL